MGLRHEHVERYNLTDSVYFALRHAAYIYPELVPEERLAAVWPATTDFLDEYGAPDGDVQRWQLPLSDRLFSTARKRSMDGSSSVPHL